MRTTLHAQLIAIARREAGAGSAEDVVQESLLIAIQANRTDLSDPAHTGWLRGVVRNRARMAARAARRQRLRDTHWQALHGAAPDDASTTVSEIVEHLPPALRALAALILTGHNRREIAYLLALPDTALRQRISALKRHLAAQDIARPQDMIGLNLDLAYGRIRDALLPALHRHGGVFASHDPYGHLFMMRRSQNGPSRQ